MAYRVAEFARLAGLTVRTLQYYDRIDLLKPSQVTKAGHRRYEKGDLIRLQQIVTLKWMGFSLSHIKTILDNPTYDLRASLAIQKAAIDAKIDHLRQASEALGRVLEQANDPDTDTLSTIIQGVSGGDHESWVKAYYSEEAWRGLQTRRLAYAPEQIEQAQQDWSDLFADFEQQRHQPADSPAVQQLAAQMQALIDLFTGGDPETEAGLARFNQDVHAGNLPPGFDGPTVLDFGDPELRQFMQRALTLYRERKQR